MTPERILLCGTRAAYRHSEDDYRVVCASCGGGGSRRHHTREEAVKACVRDSEKPCAARPPCGAR